MQFDSQRAFPYPVWRPDVDDYTDGEFQALVDLTFPEASSKFHLDAQFALSVDEIADQIAKGNARFVLVLSCRDTYTRQVLETPENTILADFSAGSLRGEVEIYPYVVAQKEIAGFTCPYINSEFGAGPFTFDKGAVLALDRPKAVYVDRDLFRPITSIFQLVVKEGITGAEWQLNCSGDYVQIALSAHMKAKIDAARNSSTNRAILINSIYFASVMQCVRYLSDIQDGDARRWVQIFSQQMQNHGIALESHAEYHIAETLLKMPLSMLDTYVFQEQGQ
jgi:hypothetical protein